MQNNKYREPALSASEIAAHLGLHRAGRDWRGNCPCCGYHDSFAVTEKDGRTLAWCASCGDQRAIGALLRNVGALPERLADRVERLPRHRPDRESRIARALAVWSGSEPLTANSPAAKYLARRRIEHAIASPALRWRRDTPHPSGGRRLALIARIDGPDGEFAAIQRIFIKHDGSKDDIEPVKASLGVVAGGAVRLQVASYTLVICEGIESAASAGVLLGLPAWSAVSAGNLAKSMILPPEIRSVVIAADADEPGEEAAKQAAWRWQAEGKAVKIARPFRSGADFNDIAREIVQ